MAIPLSSNLPWDLANNLWAQSLNPLITNPINSVQILSNVSLITGSNTINHRLGHLMTGWFVIDPQGTATVYRSAPLNNVTLTLTASAAIVLSIGVF